MRVSICALLILLANTMIPSLAGDLAQEARDFITAAVKDGPRQTSLPGTGRVKLTSADAKGIAAEAEGIRLSLPWKALREKQLFALVHGLLRSNDMAGYKLATQLALKADKTLEMEKTLEALAVSDPAALKTVKALRAQLAASKPKPTTPAKKAPEKRANKSSPPPLPKITAPILFDTPEADAIMSRIELLPPNHILRMDISKLPVLPNSDRMVARAGADRNVHCNTDMNFVIVPPDQPRVPAKLQYVDESEKGPYPIPDNAPIENWPLWGEKDLKKLQTTGTGDRHMIVLDPAAKTLWEFFDVHKKADGWTAGCVARFDYATWKLRPRGWTSADASGMSILAVTPRYDECERGEVNHAIRVTLRESRQGWVFPARHQATRKTDPDLPVMGQRFRLKASVDISKFPKHAKAIARAMQVYGLVLADHGSPWFISTVPDKRITGLRALHKLKGSDFEAVQMPPHPEDNVK